MIRDPALAALNAKLQELDEELSLPLLAEIPLASWDDVRQRLMALTAMVTASLVQTYSQLPTKRGEALAVATKAIHERNPLKAIAMLRRALS